MNLQQVEYAQVNGRDGLTTFSSFHPAIGCIGSFVGTTSDNGNDLEDEFIEGTPDSTETMDFLDLRMSGEWDSAPPSQE